MGFFSDIFYFIIVIGILILIHELGHFIAARMTGMRADVFSIGMGWRFIGYNKIQGFSFGSLPENIDLQGHTDYRLAIFPIGGYVKIVGMVDESFDTEFAGKPPESYEFRAKNTFQKAFVLSAGVIMNALLAIIIFAGIVFFNGEQTYNTTTIAYVQKESVAEIIGLDEGDKIVKINDNQVDNWGDVIKMLTTEDFGSARVVEVIRDGQTQILTADGGKVIRALSERKSIGIEPDNMKTVIIASIFDKPAQKAGIIANDTIHAINGQPIRAFTQFIDILQANPDKSLFVEWKRNNKIIGDSIKTDERGTIGIQISQVYTGDYFFKEYGVVQAASFGVNQTISSINLLFSSVAQIFKGNLSFKESIGGPIMIAKQASAQAERGIVSFLSFMALLSISLAVLNFLPFPALDGGHLVFVLIEGLIRREIPIKVKLAFQQAGIIILLLFMAYVLYNDIIR